MNAIQVAEQVLKNECESLKTAIHPLNAYQIKADGDILRFKIWYGDTRDMDTEIDAQIDFGNGGVQINVEHPAISQHGMNMATRMAWMVVGAYQAAVMVLGALKESHAN